MKTNKTLKTVCLLLIMTVSGALYSCNKSDNNSNSGGGSSSVSLLTGSRWTYQKREYLKNGVWTADSDPADAPMFTIGFNSNGTFTEDDEGPNGISPGTWAFSSNNTVMTTSGGIGLYPAVYQVITLSSSTLVLTTPINSPTITSERFTLVH